VWPAATRTSSGPPIGLTSFENKNANKRGNLFNAFERLNLSVCGAAALDHYCKIVAPVVKGVVQHQVAVRTWRVHGN
jgi:hypothetical protein